MLRLLAYCFTLHCLLGCRHQFRVESTPPGARVTYKGEDVGTTPLNITLWWMPFQKLPVNISLTNYRSLTFSAGEHLSLPAVTRELFAFRYKRLLGLTPRTTHQIQLIREHGPAGTWTPEEAQKSK